MAHEHHASPACTHALEYCPSCDTVFCNTCKAEWVRGNASVFSFNHPSIGGGFAGAFYLSEAKSNLAGARSDMTAHGNG